MFQIHTLVTGTQHSYIVQYPALAWCRTVELHQNMLVLSGYEVVT